MTMPARLVPFVLVHAFKFVVDAIRAFPYLQSFQLKQHSTAIILSSPNSLQNPSQSNRGKKDAQSPRIPGHSPHRLLRPHRPGRHTAHVPQRPDPSPTCLVASHSLQPQYDLLLFPL
ncbi:hypothetical protein V8C26DRAFT_219708 [Trichoderma gracile]